MPAIKNLQQKLDKEITTLLKPSLEKYKGRGKKTKVSFEEFLADKMLVIATIKEGIPYSIFELIQDYAPFNESEWAKFLDISTKSLQRYKQLDKHFKPSQSEKIIELSEVINAGLTFFDSVEIFKLWLETPSFALGNYKPIDLLSDSYGKDLVLGELVRMEHGIFS
jgi:putative toxin-antitoxin system antitoxin component (TIGR02293 family)